VFLIIFGEFDDSPGAQGLGLLFVIVSVVLIIRGKRSKTNKNNLP